MGTLELLATRERVRGERVAWMARWGVYGALFAMAAVVGLVQGHPAGIFGMAFAAACLAYNGALTWFVRRKRSPAWVRYATATLDVAFLGLYNAFDAFTYSVYAPLTTATLLVYPIIIVVATLRLDRGLIIWTTVLSVVASNLLFAACWPRLDHGLAQGFVSGDIPGQVYRSLYLVFIGALCLTVPGTVRRLLRTQKELLELSIDRLEQANTDALTGLPNRRHLETQLDTLIDRARTAGRDCAVLYLDLDGFKPVNDTWGHECGDQVLQECARRMSQAVRGSDLVARVGGDEFVVVATSLESHADLEQLAERLLEALRRPLDGIRPGLSVGASIGVARMPLHGASAETLLRAADQAMYRAKQSGKDRWALADEPVNGCS